MKANSAMPNACAMVMRTAVAVLLFVALSHATAPVEGRDSSQVIAQKIIKSDVPVLIDFSATWCAPCRVLGPTIEELAREYAGRITVMKVDIDMHRRIANYFGVRAVPAVFIVQDKKVVHQLAGLQPKEAYVSAIEQVLNN